MKSVNQAPKPKTGLRWPATLAVIGSLLLVGSSVAWSHYTEINGAVIASGQVVVRGKPKSVQHLDGGVVEEILVKDGDRVNAGDPLLRLDATLLRANLKIYNTRYVNALSLRDRLIAEQGDREEITFDNSDPLLQDLDFAAARKGQQAIFESRREVRKGRFEQLREKVAQFNNQISGTNVLIAAKEEQLTYIDKELKSLSTLVAKRLARESQILSIQRARADILGQVGEHRSELARIANSIRDTELEILQQTRQMREEVVMELRDVTTTIEELVQQIFSTQKQLDRIEVRTPVAGIVHEMQFSTIGGVIPPGGTIMQIIPTNGDVVFETRVNPASVDQVHIGQTAKLMFTAFNQRTTPEILGMVENVSANTVEDRNTGETFYRAQIVVAKKELDKLNGQELVPGMPVEAFLQTGERSVISYLLRPLTDQVARAFREE